MSFSKSFNCKVNGVTFAEVKMDGEVWQCRWGRVNYKVNFSECDLPSEVIKAAKCFLRKKLTNNGPACLTRMHIFLRFLSAQWLIEWKDFSSIKLLDLRDLWNKAPPESLELMRGSLKSFYIYCAENDYCSADCYMAAEIKSWMGTRGEKAYRDVLNWHEERGAMTSVEQEILISNLKISGAGETTLSLFTRILILSAHETLKRPIQLAEMKSDGLVEVTQPGKQIQYFLRIPKVKKQRGRMSELWPVSNFLGGLIKNYSLIPNVSISQSVSGLLFVGQGHPFSHGFEPSRLIDAWSAQRNIISPRTGRRLVITLYRIRHSGATALAMQGVGTAEIQYILEHDTPDACRAYIDAIGSELAPVIDKANRNLGEIFTQLNEVYFKGSISRSLDGVGILIPVVEAPAVVGSCGFSGKCNKHPFFQCYNGCQFFIALRSNVHHKSLDFIQSELNRWEEFEGMHERSKAIKDFERIAYAIKNVLDRINSNA